MKLKKPIEESDKMHDDCDFDLSEMERERYAHRLTIKRSNLVLIEPDLTKIFPNTASVNAALRAVVEFSKVCSELTQRSGKRLGKRRAA